MLLTVAAMLPAGLCVLLEVIRGRIGRTGRGLSNDE